MKTIDYVLLFNAGIFMLFAGPHILADDGNVSAMGWDIAKFMPLKGRNPLPVPTEITLLISHICAILGSAQSSLIAMMLMAVSMGDAGAKKLAIYTMIVNQIMVVLMQFYKPSGTGAEGSPEMGPLPLMIGLMVPSFVGAYVA